MRVLVVETTSERQAATAERFDSLDRSDRDLLDLSVSLANETTLLERFESCDIVFLGASLGEQALHLTRLLKQKKPSLDVLVCVGAQSYSGGAFRSALANGARKVFSEGGSPLDLVQELMSIHEEMRTRGSIRTSRVIAVVQAKGGVGSTSACAAIAEACARGGRRSLLWDLDVETRDLCRAFAVEGDHSSSVRRFITGELEVSRESIRKAYIPATTTVSIFPPPDTVAASVALTGGMDAIGKVEAIANLMRVTHDTVIIDLGSRLSPAAATLMRNADAVVVMLDDSLLGLSAAQFYLPTIRSIVRSPDAIYFLRSGTSMTTAEMAKLVDPENLSTERAWSLPPIPFDSGAAKWPGSGKTLYSIGKKATQRAFDEIAIELRLVDSHKGTYGKGEKIPSPIEALDNATSHFSVVSALRVLSQRSVTP